MIAKKRHRRGAAAVEFAAVAPIMILFMFGIVELGRMLMIKNALTHASREGARLAVTPNATTSDVEERVGIELQPYFSTVPDVVLTPANLSASDPGELVTVRVEVDIADITWIPGAINIPLTKLIAETTMRRENAY